MPLDDKKAFARSPRTAKLIFCAISPVSLGDTSENHQRLGRGSMAWACFVSGHRIAGRSVFAEPPIKYRTWEPGVDLVGV